MRDPQPNAKCHIVSCHAFRKWRTPNAKQDFISVTRLPNAPLSIVYGTVVFVDSAPSVIPREPSRSSSTATFHAFMHLYAASFYYLSTCFHYRPVLLFGLRVSRSSVLKAVHAELRYRLCPGLVVTFSGSLKPPKSCLS